MGLLSISRKIKRNGKEMRTLMVGLDKSGKTTIVLKINGEYTSVISPTPGFNIKTIQYQTVPSWETAKQINGLVWVVDSSDVRGRDYCHADFHNLLDKEANYLAKNTDNLFQFAQNKRLAGSSLLVFTNKQDIQGALKPEKFAKLHNLEVMTRDRKWKIAGCSAYTGEGLLHGFDWLVQDIASRIYVLD